MSYANCHFDKLNMFKSDQQMYVHGVKNNLQFEHKLIK